MHEQNSGEGFGDNGFQMMGMMNALKTGDVHTDMIIAMCVPFVLRAIFAWLDKIEDIQSWQIWSMWWTKEEPQHHRSITHSTTRNCWGYSNDYDEDTKNAVLLKAIKMYLHQVVKLKLKRAHLDLTQLQEDSGSIDYDSDDEEEYGCRKTMVGMLSRYKVINRLPANEWYTLGSYGKPSGIVKLHISMQNREEGEDNERQNKRKLEVNETTFHIKSSQEGAVDAFVDTVYSWYVGELRKQEDNSRYLYEMKNPEIKIGNSDGDDDSNGSKYKRYKLSDEKCFDSLFFKEKKNLLGLIEHFTKKTGKYSIKGYPHKLGVLLHGPPGTGKTSLIKALAHHTGRSIVNVPLSKISTNSELMSIFFDRSYHVDGSCVPVKLNFKDVIFVMEDVDAATKIVKRRDGRKITSIDDQGQVNLPAPRSLWRMFLESTSDDCKILVQELTKKSERLKEDEASQRPEILRSMNQRLAGLPALGLVGAGGLDSPASQLCNEALESASNLQGQFSKLDEILTTHAKTMKSLLDSGTEVDDSFINNLLGEVDCIASPTLAGKLEDSTSESGAPYHQSWPSILDTSSDSSNGSKTSLLGSSLRKRNPDALSLSGLLNVLDGVVDTPGRIVIMTTNHPEMLDPALIRPGRVDKKLLLGYMAAADIVSMLEHYFQTELEKCQVARVEEIVDGSFAKTSSSTPVLKLTPAQVEQMAVEHEQLSDMILALEKMSPAFIPPTSKERPFTLISKSSIDRHRSR